MSAVARPYTVSTTAVTTFVQRVGDDGGHGEGAADREQPEPVPGRAGSGPPDRRPNGYCISSMWGCSGAAGQT
ncbi:hypothetical protein GCM10010425_18630 [Streptomyces spororaveus]|uniref:Uncharacterized protein n=1 Tax=Streptomyces spororaveus TaxID=284039 RepID=A0ABQ3T7Q6_9ACTN|nr:hypothetical protein Sspor_20050 [Streptomyces spororaveus]